MSYAYSPLSKEMEKLKRHLEIQLEELEMLQSVFCNPGEIKINDLSVLTDIKDFINGILRIVPSFLDYTVNLTIENSKFEMCVTVPHEYPDIEPNVFVRNSEQNRIQQQQLSNDLSEYIKSLEKGEVCVFSAITWLQENALSYIQAKENKVIEPPVSNTDMSRYWIYSHHIYSKTKRREIFELANTYNLTGFCTPGKPGVICLEGYSNDCAETWQQIKAMNWKKIICRKIENEEAPSDFRKFKKFEEIAFQNEGSKNKHTNVGELQKYLTDHDCSYVFKDIFGVETKGS